MTTHFRNLFFLSLLAFGFAQAAVAGTKVDIQTNMGQIVVELDDKKAPKTVQNFLTYVKEGFYNGTIFHRVIGGFMIQGGGMTTDMRQKSTYSPIVNEGTNGLTNQVGTIAMARTNDPNSATSQFFINVADNTFLNASPTNPGYAVFGRVIKGMDVVMKISKVETTRQDIPVKPVVIESITIEQPAASTPTTTIK